MYQIVDLWTKRNTMSVNCTKSAQMFISSHVDFDGSTVQLSDIPVTDEIKILCVTLDKRMSWKTHIDVITKKAAKRINVLRRLKPFIPIESLVTVYEGSIRSILEYCAPLFVKMTATNSDQF